MSIKQDVRHFTDISAIPAEELRFMLNESRRRKACLKTGQLEKPLAGKILAMIFEKPSTRTRVSFDVAMRQLGGETLMLTGSEMQLGRSETIADTAKVLSRYVNIIMIRTTAHARMVELTQHATVPVINGLTDDTHPCQIMADILTYEEHRGPVKGRIFAWVGDGNNVLHSLIEAAVRFDFNLNIATPQGSEPHSSFLNWAQANGGKVMWTTDPVKAVSGADCVVTDSWVSMGHEDHARGHNIFMPYQINQHLMSFAKPNALFMHCLPAHRGEEVTDDVIDGAHSVVFDEAENRLHAQKAILDWCLKEMSS